VKDAIILEHAVTRHSIVCRLAPEKIPIQTRPAADSDVMCGLDRPHCRVTARLASPAHANFGRCA